MSKFMKKSVNLKREPEGVNSIASLRLFKFQILGPIFISFYFMDL